MPAQVQQKDHELTTEDVRRACEVFAENNNVIFDAAYYVSRYPEVAEAGIEPLFHYLETGWREGRNPSPGFDTNYYIKNNMPVRAVGVNPLVHYITTGAGLGVATSDATSEDAAEAEIAEVIRNYFDADYYLTRYGGTIAPNLDALRHFIRHGVRRRFNPNDWFDVAYYARTYYAELAAGENPLYHYARHGRPLGYAPSAEAAAAQAAQAAQAVQPAEGSAEDELRKTGLFDAAYYRERNPDLANVTDLLWHYMLAGEIEGRRPNPYFDPAWYRTKYGVQSEDHGGLLMHYYQWGEIAGYKPCAVFDPAWYSENYGLPDDVNALAHFLEHLPGNRHSPNAYFSPRYYLKHSPDVEKAGVEPFRHFLQNGVFEGRRGSELFDQDYVWAKYLGNDRTVNPFVRFMDEGVQQGWLAAPARATLSVHQEVKKFCAPGPDFEARPLPAGGHRTRAKAIAFYLPQFHPIPENDAWWGTGFTEWRNVMRGVPRFINHYQPRIPRDLGFYDLNDGRTLKRQVDMARAAGLYGFCFYYYNFNGHRLLEKPLDAYVESPEIDFPFCLMWANENWSRRWDGMEQDVLIRQDYKSDDAADLVDDFARYMKRPNYITADGRPVLYIYRADIIPDCARTLDNWRRLFRERHDLDPIIGLTQAFGCNDPSAFGFDGAIEFPPHKLAVGMGEKRGEVELLDPNFKGYVRSYDELVEASLKDVDYDFPLIKTAVPMWDNEARKQGDGMVFHGGSPKTFENWLSKLTAFARAKPYHGEPFVFINAWNEWAEGSYLEPDCHYGYAYLNAVTRAVHEPIFPAATHERKKLVLVGHDAHPHGAQILLLNIGRVLKNRFGYEISFILMGGGPMVPQYEKLAPTFVVAPGDKGAAELEAHIVQLKTQGFSCALTNSVVSGLGALALKGKGFTVASLIHELPQIVHDNNLVGHYAAIRDNSDLVIFPNLYVRRHIEEAFGTPSHDVDVRPQGLYSHVTRKAGAREAVRTQLGLKASDRIVINIAFGDHRKGLDLFAEIAGKVAEKHDDIHFLWLGELHIHLIADVKAKIAADNIRNVHFVPFSPDLASYLSASDLFLLTSREDPFPSVLLDAIAVGLPVAAFENGGGYVDLLKDDRIGTLIPYLDTAAAASTVPQILDNRANYGQDRVDYRREVVAGRFDFADYCAYLAGTVEADIRRVSVVVPNYNYASYLPSRMDTIRHQTYPVYETLVLDDKSPDDSLRVLKDYAAETGFIFETIENETNSGSGYRQWDKGALMTRGEFVWIAEADDLAAPDFLSEAMQVLTTTNASFVFCDSMQIDEFNNELAPTYGYYFDTIEPGAFNDDFVMSGDDFVRRFLAVKNAIMNVSSVVWRRADLIKVLDATRDLHLSMRVACDWKMYALAGLAGGQIGYVAKPLNVHRRHSGSVTHSRNAQKHFDEIADVQKFVAGEVALSPAAKTRQADYLREVSGYLGLEIG